MKTEAKWIIDQGKYKKIACVYGDSASGKTGLEGLGRELEGTGIEIVAAEALKEVSTSASVQIAKIAKVDHDLVMIFGFTMQPAAVAIKEVKKVGLDSDIMINQPITNNTTLSMLEGVDVDGLYGSWWGALEYREEKPENSPQSMRDAAAVLEKSQVQHQPRKPGRDHENGPENWNRIPHARHYAAMQRLPQLDEYGIDATGRGSPVGTLCVWV